ncbi:MAG: hypothetical protein Q4D79_14955 [Propionibacteriaceae bacterium]|nr:hypothetical protein [Propionibacteriaceae bacterium]
MFLLPTRPLVLNFDGEQFTELRQEEIAHTLGNPTLTARTR